MGCEMYSKIDASKYPLVPALSEKEVIDYYKQALNYGSISVRNTEVYEISYDTKPVDDSEVNKLKEMVNESENILKSNKYVYSEENTRIISENTFNYIKSFLNDKKLVNGNIIDMQKALGHYFVDVEYKVKAGNTGTFKPQASLLGIHGAFVSTLDGEDIIDDIFIGKVVSDMNKYYADNKIDKKLVYDKVNNCLHYSSDDRLDYLDFRDSVVDEEVRDEILNNGDGGIDVEGAIGEDNDLEDSQVDGFNESIDISTRNISVIEDKVILDTSEINRVAGSSKANSAYVPKLDMIYNRPQEDGNISGIGILKSNSDGLRYFGYNRDNIEGKVILRYVFKEDLSKERNLMGVNIYPVLYELESGISVNTEDIIVPDFLVEEFRKLVERLDRAVVNVDIVALTSGDIYDKIGKAVLVGFKDKYVNTQRYVSELKRVIARDMQNDMYLVEVETIVQEGVKGLNTFGVFKDKYYVVIKQLGDKFVVNDLVLMARSMVKEPSISPDSSIKKRLIALNLAGEVSEKAKDEIVSLLNDLYRASNYRLLYGPKELVVDGEKVVVEKGMYDCFNDDVSMLPSSKKEYLNATLREILVKEGIDTNSVIKGNVVEWVGGADNQVELISEELVEYIGKNKGIYMQVYYLVSKMHDKWVIDDIKIIDSEIKTGVELESIRNRFN